MDPSVIDSSRVPLGRVAILGCGKLGEALLAPLLAADAVSRADLIATARRDERLARLRERFGIEVTTDNQRAVEGADVVLLCVKPQTACLVLDEVSAGLGADQ
ncbi:MAG: NAD(P)-binding domain-containing protein, partial [Acidobacteriota bacterium]